MPNRAGSRLRFQKGGAGSRSLEYLVETGVFITTTTAADDYSRQISTSDLTGLDASKYPFLQQRPVGVSLEGYLFPDTYEFPLDGTDARGCDATPTG